MRLYEKRMMDERDICISKIHAVNHKRRVMRMKLEMTLSEKERLLENIKVRIRRLEVEAQNLGHSITENGRKRRVIATELKRVCAVLRDRSNFMTMGERHEYETDKAFHAVLDEAKRVLPPCAPGSGSAVPLDPKRPTVIPGDWSDGPDYNVD
jgi:hypothetical protein